MSKLTRALAELAKRADAGDEASLMFLHNTTANKLERIQSMGGMPMPSIAITDKDIPFEGFGDITLVGKPESFDPKANSLNQAFSADAYTIRAPRPLRIAKKGAGKKFRDLYGYDAKALDVYADQTVANVWDLEKKGEADGDKFDQVVGWFDRWAGPIFLKRKGIEFNKEDGREIYDKLQPFRQSGEFKQWADDAVDELFEPDEYFVANPDRDYYTQKPKLKPYTADEILKVMRRSGGRGGEGGMATGTSGSVRAAYTDKLTSLDAMRKRKDQLRGDIAIEKEEITNLLGDLGDALKPYYKYDPTGASYRDAVSELMTEGATRGLKRSADFVGFENIPKDLMGELEEFQQILKTAPTEYFESKPQRVVKLNEFAGAIVPEGTRQSTIDLLTKQGLEIEQYADDAQRLEARKKFKKLLFQLPPVTATAIAGAVAAGSAPEAQAGPISSGIKRLASAYEKVASPQAEGVARMVEQGQISPEQADKYANTIKAYKLFRTKGGNTDELFPLFVNANKPVKMGEWNPAESGSLTDAGKVKSSIGPLAYRPGWHAGDAPVATHIGGKSDSALKAPDYRPADQVWAEVEMPADVDWQSVADSRMEYSKAGKPIPRTAQITDQIPEGGYYRYKTNPNMTGDWLIAGDMKVNRILTPSEVYQINAERGVHDLPPVDENGKMLWSLALGSGLAAAGVAPEEAKAELLSEVPQEQAQQLQDNWSQIEANAQAGLGGMGVRMPPTAEDEEAMLAPTGGDLMQQANRDFAGAIRTQPEPDFLTGVQQSLLSGIMKTAGVADLSADVVSAMAGPLLSAPGAIARYAADRYVPGVNYTAEEMAQGRRETEDYFNYQPRTEQGPQYGEQIMQGIGGAIAPYVPAIKKAAGDSYILGAMRQGYDYLGEREKELAKALMDLSPI